MRIPHPIPYQGSKRGLAPVILKYFPSGKVRLFEPFVGSAAVSLAAAARGIVSGVVLNDTNAPLMGLWKRIINEPEELIAAYTRLWNEQNGQEREYYDRVRDEFNRSGKPDLLLYLLARCVKASVRYNANGDFNQSPDNRRRGARPETMGAHIRGASKLLRGKTEILSLDYRAAIREANQVDLIYMDPPYQGVCGNRDPRYVRGVLLEEFIAALEDLNRRRLCYIISYDGRTGDKEHGSILPGDLKLTHLEVDAGPSSQATLLGRYSKTIESLYISPALARRLGKSMPGGIRRSGQLQPTFF